MTLTNFCTVGAVRISSREFDLFRELVHAKTGISLSDAKRTLVESRLAKRLRHYGLTSYLDYYRRLVEEDPNDVELQLMINCITTNKTEFFRERHHFDFLAETVLADRMRKAQAGGPRRVRIWSAACSRGHEPYTIAMTLLDTLPRDAGWDAKILASDIDTDVLDHARQGVYSLQEIADVPVEARSRHFLRGTGCMEGKCQVKPALKELVSFRRINLVRDAFEIRTRFDVIFLRNVMIYFDRATQRHVLDKLKPFLQPNGYLILGHSENICWRDSGYAPLGATVYQLEETAS